MKKLLLLFAACSVLGTISPVVHANDEMTSVESAYYVPTKIWATGYRSAFLRHHLPQSIFYSTYYNGYYYSGTLYLTSIGKSDANDGVKGTYTGYIYGGRATTSRAIYLDK